MRVYVKNDGANTASAPNRFASQRLDRLDRLWYYSAPLLWCWRCCCWWCWSCWKCVCVCVCCIAARARKKKRENCDFRWAISRVLCTLKPILNSSVFYVAWPTKYAYMHSDPASIAVANGRSVANGHTQLAARMHLNVNPHRIAALSLFSNIIYDCVFMKLFTTNISKQCTGESAGIHVYVWSVHFVLICMRFITVFAGVRRRGDCA